MHNYKIYINYYAFELPLSKQNLQFKARNASGTRHNGGNSLWCTCLWMRIFLKIMVSEQNEKSYSLSSLFNKLSIFSIMHVKSIE